MASKRKSTTQTMAITPAIYCRVSTQEQADSGLGLAAQQARCSATLVAKGWPDAVIYTDEGISGTYGPEKRPGLALLLSAVEAGLVNAVIVLDLSRLGRSVKLVTGLIEDFDRQGVAFVSCKENFDTSTAMGRAMLGLIAVFGQLERDLTSERTEAALAERGKRHGYKSGPLPLGYTRTPGQELISVDEPAAQLVRQVFELRGQGLTLRSIAAALNASSRSAGPATWYNSTVRVVLQNEPVYRGQREYWPRILY